MKVITLKIQLDDKSVKKGIDDIGDGLEHLSKIDAKNLKENLDHIDKTTFNQIKSQTNSVSASLAKAAQLSLKFDNQLAKLRERDTELAKLNRTLSQPGVAAKIDETTKALLRQKAAAVDAATLSSQNSLGGIGGFASTVVGATLISTATSKALSLVTSLASEVANLGVESVKLSSKLELTTNALNVFTGSTRRTKQELVEIDQAARDTPGLRLESAEEGYTRLRALGFAAETSRKLVVGLAKQKLIANVDEDAVNRVIINLTQLSAGSARASQDLKELVQNIPSLRPVLEDAFKTADPKIIGALFKNNPDEALKRLADALEKAKAPVAGLDDASGKLTDSLIELGRTVGTPIVEPLTTSVGKMTDAVRNNQSEWAKLGQVIGDTIRGANITIDELNKPKPSSGGVQNRIALLFGYDSVEKFNADLEKAFKPLSADKDLLKRIGVTPLADIGAKARFAEEQRKVLIEEPNLGGRTPKEIEADALNAERLANRAREVARQENLVSLQISSKEAEQILQNRYQVEKALLDSNIRNTTEQEKQYIQQSFELKNRSIQSEIALKTGQFNKEIALNEGNILEIAKIESEKNLAIGKLQNELKLNSISSFKEIQAVERKITEERRQAAIEAQSLNTQEVNFQVDNELSDIKRQIDQKNDFADEGYAKLIEITNKGYGLVLQATKESLALQLQNESLTVEQRNNLIGKGYLEEAKLAEDNRRKILQIEDDRYQKQINNLKSFTEFIKGQYKDLSGLFEGVGSFFNPTTFNKSTVGNLQEILLQKSAADKLKLMLRTGSRSP